MKHLRIISSVSAILSMLLGIYVTGASAQTTITFEDVALPESCDAGSYYRGADLAGGYVSGNLFFPTACYPEWGYYWENWGASNCTETSPPSSDPDEYYSSVFPSREFSAMTPGGGGHLSSNYAISYRNFTAWNTELHFQQPLQLSDFYITNTNYAYYLMHDGAVPGSGFQGKKFGHDTPGGPDYFYITVTGKDTDGNQTGTPVVFFLADFRDPNPANQYIIDDWTQLDLSSLGNNVRSLEFTWASTDYPSGQPWNIYTPAYFAMDDLTLAQNPYASAWNGGGTDNSWSNPANFGGVGHASGESALFDGTVQLTADNDFGPEHTFGAVTFGTQAGPFTLTGNAMKLLYDLTNFSSATQTLETPVVLVGGNQSVYTAMGDIRIDAPISELGGSFGITKTGPHTLTLSADGSYTGPTKIVEGALALAGDSDLSATSEIQVSAGAEFSIVEGTHTVGAIDGAGETILAEDTQLTAAGIRQGALTIGAGAKLTIAPSESGAASGGAPHSVPEPGAWSLIAAAVWFGFFAFRKKITNK
jgi:autotransporter-associated beta strand protein